MELLMATLHFVPVERRWMVFGECVPTTSHCDHCSDVSISPPPSDSGNRAIGSSTLANDHTTSGLRALALVQFLGSRNNFF